MGALATALLCLAVSLAPRAGGQAPAGPEDQGSLKPIRYILYDVNPGEGFNLRRDVYMRMAVFVKKLNKSFPSSYWTLVLPPWGHLYHWQSRQLGHQVRIPWSDFFDVSSLALYVPVVEFHEWKERTAGRLGAVYYLQGYKEGWDDGKFEEKFDLRDCIGQPGYEEGPDGRWHGEFFFHEGVTADRFACLSVQGHTSVLADWVADQQEQSIMLDRAENVLHDWFGDVEYWGARRSMRFARRLVARADLVRQVELGSTDSADGTGLPADWREEGGRGRAGRGGPFACVHLRRGDYARGRGARAPTIAGAAKQLEEKLSKRSLTTLFVSTDADSEEFDQLVAELYIKGLKAVRFRPTAGELEDFRDGGVAIVDQAVCRHAKYFIGSKESTFTFRIQEEREIREFPLKDTFDMLCPAQGECERGTEWKVEWGEPGHRYQLPGARDSGLPVREEL